MAWFHSVPEQPKQAHKKGARAASTLSRGEEIRSKGGTPLLPEVVLAPYLLHYWEEMGMVSAGTMGPTSLTHSAICAWEHLSGVELQPWEVRAIRAASAGYIRTFHAAKDPQCPPPYGVKPTEVNLVDVSKRLAGLFASMNSSTKRKPQR